MAPSDLRLFALDSSRAFGRKVAAKLGVPLSAHEERDFEDGEHKARALVNVRGADAFVVHSLHGEERETVNDKLCRLLFFIGALKDASAARVTAVVPYLGYARKDRKTKPRDPVTTRYVAALFEAVGTDRVVTLEVHNLAAFQNAFRCRTEHLDAARLFADYFASVLAGSEIVVVSPDAGGVKRAERFRDALARTLHKDIPTAFLEKYRSSGVVSGGTVVGEVEARAAVIIDDLISTGTTVARAARACRERGATAVFAAAAHGLFVGEAGKVLSDPALEQVVVTDTIPPFRLDPEVVREKVIVLDAAALFAEAIERMHRGGSIVELLEG
ncbi:MAG: ribose-phosphate diphosphokinase [Kiloniellaceae bacterium]